MTKRFNLILTIILAIFLAGCGGTQKENAQSDQGNNTSNQTEQQKHEELVIGVIPTMNQGDLQVAMDKLGAHLEENVGMPVKIDVYPDYQGVVESMTYGDVNMAYLGPLTYVIAHEDNGTKAIVTMLIDGQPYYHSYIITHKDSPLNSLEDLVENSADLTFAFGDPNSTSGTLVPGLALKEAGVYESPNDYSFKNVVFTGGHDASAIAVENKQFDAASVDSAIFKSLQKTGKIGDDFKVIWESEKLFQYPWSVSEDMDDELIKKIREAFYSITDEDILNAFGASGFTEANDEDYEVIRQAAKEAGRLN